MSEKIGISEDVVINKIYEVRGVKVMIDRDLAELYGVETKYLKRQVRRNIERFPSDFMFELNKKELNNLRSQFGTSSWGGVRYQPMAFAEQGIAQLSSVLKSERAIKVNIHIIRLFTKMREMILNNKEILLKLEQMEKNVLQNSDDVKVIFEALKQLINNPAQPRKMIGFKQKK